MMKTNLFVIANPKQLRTGGSFRILLPFFFRIFWSVGVLNSAIFKFSQSGWVWHDFGRVFRISGGGGGEHPKPPPRYATGRARCEVTVLRPVAPLLETDATCQNSYMILHFITWIMFKATYSFQTKGILASFETANSCDESERKTVFH